MFSNIFHSAFYAAPADILEIALTASNDDSFILSSRGRHALMAMIELARQDSQQPLSLARIADTGGISLSYLEQLFACLRRAGLVSSARGPGGGYRLARNAQDIRVSDILLAAEDCAPARRGARKEAAGGREAAALWAQISQMLQASLNHITLADVANDNIDGHPVFHKVFETLR